MSRKDEGSIPSHDLEANDWTWEYERVDPRTHRWSRPLDDDEYEWDESDVDVVGSDRPVRVVSLQRHDEWTIEGLETGGPDTNRPGFTETISSDYLSTTDDIEESVAVVREFVEELS